MKSSKVFWIWASIIVVSICSSGSQAEVVFQQPEPPARSPWSRELDYPVSRFGMAPSQKVDVAPDSVPVVSAGMPEILKSKNLPPQRGLASTPSSSVPANSAVESMGDSQAGKVETVVIHSKEEPTERQKVQQAVSTVFEEKNSLEKTADKLAGVQELSLLVSKSGFFPKTLFVNRGIPVRLFLTSASSDPLCFMIDAFNIRRSVRNDRIGEVMLEPKEPGQYRFYCPITATEGTLVVRE